MESRWTSLSDSGQASLSRFGAPASRGRSGRGETPRPHGRGPRSSMMVVHETLTRERADPQSERREGSRESGDVERQEKLAERPARRADLDLPPVRTVLGTACRARENRIFQGNRRLLNLKTDQSSFIFGIA